MDYTCLEGGAEAVRVVLPCHTSACDAVSAPSFFAVVFALCDSLIVKDRITVLHHTSICQTGTDGKIICA